MIPQRGDVERTGDPKGPRERSTALGKVDAGRVGVHGGTTAGQAPGGVDDEEAVGHDDA